MYSALLLYCSLFILHVACTSQFYGHHGRRVCGRDGRPSSSVVLSTESYVQPVHKPYITLCQDHRLCSTYKTVYRVSYRQVSRAGPLSHFYPECCPGWRRLHSHNCNQAVCVQACVNGGTCLRPNHCACPLGWMGRHCQTDVDECEQALCSQQCVNTAGSYRCVCGERYRLAQDGHSCLSLPPPPPPPPPPPRPTPTPTPTAPASQPRVDDLRPSNNSAGGGHGLVENVTEEVQILKNRVELLEQKLQMVLAPFSSLFPLPLDEGVSEWNSFLSDRGSFQSEKSSFLSEKSSFLSHSLQQLDRIDSLSEQVGFLEERLGTCSCQEN